jgi:hypothetical protein
VRLLPEAAAIRSGKTRAVGAWAGDFSAKNALYRALGRARGLALRLAKRPDGSRLAIVTRRRILYWLAVMVAVLVVGTIIGLIWADTSDVAGAIAVVADIAAGVGIVALLISLAVVTRRQRRPA